MRKQALSIIYLASLAAEAFSFPIRITNFGELLDQAPIVVGATVVDNQPGNGSASIYSFPAEGFLVSQAVVEVRAVYKGDPCPARISVPYLYAFAAPDAFLGMEKGTSYILFLKRSGDDYLLCDPQNGAYPVADEGFSEAGQGTTPAEQLRRVFEVSLSSQNEDIVACALEALAFCGNPETLSKIDGFNSSSNEVVRIAAHTASVKLGDWNRIKDIVMFWEGRSYPDGAVLSLGPRYRNLSVSSRNEIETVSNSDAVPLLVDLLNKSRNPIIKQKLISALGSIGDSRVVETLLPLLSESNRGVAYGAYVALMKLKGRPYFTPERFEEDNQDILRALNVEHQTGGTEESEGATSP